MTSTKPRDRRRLELLGTSHYLLAGLEVLVALAVIVVLTTAPSEVPAARQWPLTGSWLTAFTTGALAALTFVAGRLRYYEKFCVMTS